MIVINKFVEPECILRDSHGNVVGTIKGLVSLYNIRVQIAANKESGYYIEWNDIKIDINEQGELSDWPSGFFDELDKVQRELFLTVYKKK